MMASQPSEELSWEDVRAQMALEMEAPVSEVSEAIDNDRPIQDEPFVGSTSIPKVDVFFSDEDGNNFSTFHSSDSEEYKSEVHYINDLEDTKMESEEADKNPTSQEHSAESTPSEFVPEKNSVEDVAKEDQTEPDHKIELSSGTIKPAQRKISQPPPRIGEVFAFAKTPSTNGTTSVTSFGRQTRKFEVYPVEEEVAVVSVGRRPSRVSDSPTPPKPVSARPSSRTRTRLVETFAGRTSIHGVGLWLGASGATRRGQRIGMFVLWSGLLLGCVVLLYVTFQAYFAYEVNVLISRHTAGQTTLPAVTICPNHAGLPRSVVGNSRFVVKTSSYGNYEGPAETERTCADASAPELAPTVDAFLDLMYARGSNFSYAIEKYFFPPLDEILLECRLGQKKTPCKELFLMRSDAGGQCFTFNYNGTLEREDSAPIWPYQDHYELRKVRASGRLTGLSLLLNAKVGHFCVSPFEPIQGFRVLVHSVNTFPTRSDHAVLVPPGFRTAVGVKETVVDKRRTASIGRCVAHKDLSFFKGLPYARQNCIEQCYATEIWKRCRCIVHTLPTSLFAMSEELAGRFPVPQSERQSIAGEGAASVCWGHPTGQQCLFDTYAEFWRGESARQCHKESVCPFECLERLYDWQNSATQYPPESMMENLLNSTAGRLFKDGSAYRKNVAALDVYLATMEQVRVTETRAMPPSALFTNIGGSLGLFLGISIFSLVEVLTFVCGCLCGCALDRRR